MDQQKKHREVLRAAFTKSANELDKLLSEEAALQQVQVAWEVLLQKHKNLLMANREIYDTLLQRELPGAQSENNGGTNPDSSTMSRLESLMSFVKSEVENEDRISSAAEGFGLNSDKSRHKKANKPVSNKILIPTATGLMNCNIVKCIFCEGAIFTEDQKNTSVELAFKYAVYKINKDKDLLPNTTLVYDIQYVPRDDSFRTSKKEFVFPATKTGKIRFKDERAWIGCTD
ncbi:hypothetical protein JTB14_034368 [Gonioctena quinquepunctata]|nr:hypothetical protein JTB14_034368 [Gonioctena quinquepunctata]